MSEITITPNFEEKTATIEGVASAGEKVLVTLKNCATWNTSTLRLRVLFLKKLLAVYPVPPEEGETADTFTVSGNDLTCVLNLCTDTALKTFKRLPELDVMFILDDIDSSVRQMYFRDFHTILGWPHDVADTPIDLSGYRDKMLELEGSIADIQEQVESSIENMQTEIEGKVDKVSGKGLSTLDVTSETLSAFATDTQLQEHVNDTVRHITATERSNWNSLFSTKQDVVVADGYLYVPGEEDGGVQLWYRLCIVYDEDMGGTTTVPGDTPYVRNDLGGFSPA